MEVQRVQPTQSAQPANTPYVWEGSQRLIAYADPWTTPPEAFYDIYDLVPRLCSPDAHLQLEGRRGTGKTVLMVNAYLNLRRQFEEQKGQPPYNVAIYIDLSQDVGTPRSNAPMIRGYLLYRQILQLILTASLRPGHRRDRRFWGLQDYLDERPHWFRRVFAHLRLDRYRAYIDSLADLFYQDPLFQQMLKSLRGEMNVAQSLSSLRIARMVLPRGQAAQPRRLQARPLPEMVYEKRLLTLYSSFGEKARNLLESVLDALQIQKLILFVDEWSGPSIGSETQPYLYEQLAHTFLPGGRAVLRLATIPGATKLTFNGSSTHIPAVYLDHLANFQPGWMRKRLIRMLILNLKTSVGARFPAAAYLEEGQEKQGYPLFRADVFQDEAASDELTFASESLPRQMLIQFMAAAQLRGLYPSQRKISAGLIRMAAGQHFSTQLAVSIRQDPVVSAVFDAILRAGCRVVDVERVPVFYEALDWLVNEGVIFRCNPSLGRHSTLDDSFMRYRLSYPAEVYRLAYAATSAEPSVAQHLERFERLTVENVVYCEEYPNPPKVMLSPLAPTFFGTPAE
jgi:hypothetical protein